MTVIGKENQRDVYKELKGTDGSRPIPSKMGNRPPNLAQVLQGRGSLWDLLIQSLGLPYPPLLRGEKLTLLPPCSF